MKTHTTAVTDAGGLETLLTSTALRTDAAGASAILVQVFSARTDPDWIDQVTRMIGHALPTALVVGATTVGEISEGRTLTGATVISIACFATARLTSLAMACPAAEERLTGQRLHQAIAATGEDIAGVLLLATPVSMDAAQLLRGLGDGKGNFPIFGGGAADYAAMRNSRVFQGRQSFTQGVVAVVFSGSELHIESRTYLGWKALSKEMCITGVEGTLVKTVDHAPAFDVYRRYLDIPDDENFFLNALEFPFLLQRNGETLARVPVAVDENGALQFVADIAVGERFRLGYGDPDMIVSDSRDIHRFMGDFAPQAIFLYTCSCRRFLMQNDAELETHPFQAIAPTAGFYTYGEFFGRGINPRLLNATMLAVGMREGPGCQMLSDRPMDDQAGEELDPFAHKHARVVSRLVHFIGTVTGELEQANHHLMDLSITDKLTQVFNRGKLDAVLKGEVSRAARYSTELSIVLLDVDHFKEVNDVYGHSTGDEVLIRMAGILRQCIRDDDTVGRWGGEEFLIILPGTGPRRAHLVAEKIRSAIASAEYPVIHHKTASFGVTSYTEGDGETEMLARADMALYEAKNAGRNRVMQRQATGFDARSREKSE